MLKPPLSLLDAGDFCYQGEGDSTSTVVPEFRVSPEMTLVALITRTSDCSTFGNSMIQENRPSLFLGIFIGVIKLFSSPNSLYFTCRFLMCRPKIVVLKLSKKFL